MYSEILYVVWLRKSFISLFTAFHSQQGVPPPEEKDFIDAARLVYEGVREIRTAVLLNRNSMEFDSDDTEIDTEMASTIDSRANSTLPIGKSNC